MTFRPPGTFAVLRLLALTSLRRLLRAAHIARQKRSAQPGKRQATARKSGDSLVLLMLLMFPLIVMQSLLMTSQAVQRLAVAAEQTTVGSTTMLVPQRVLDCLQQADRAANDAALQGRLALFSIFDEPGQKQAQIIEHFQKHGVNGFRRVPEPTFLLAPTVDWPEGSAVETFAHCGTLLLLALLLMLITVSLGGANVGLAGSEWSFAWLMTFPVATRSLVLAKVLEYSLVQVFPWLTLCPLLWQLLRALGQPWPLLVAILATLATTILTGSLRFFAETWLRLNVSLRGLRSIQGACSLLSLLLMGFVFLIGLGRSIPLWFVDLGRGMPAWFDSLPAAWPMALAQHGLLRALPGVLATMVVFALAWTASVRLLAAGTMRSGGVDPGVRGVAGQWSKGTRRLGVLGKDLSLLVRDRNFLVQTLVVPLFAIGLQMIVNPDLGSVSGKGVVLVAYGIGVYSLTAGCFQVLSGEGRALWILYTLPVKVRDVLRQKTRLWATFAILFATAALLAFVTRSPDAVQPLRLAVDFAFVAAGVFGAAHLAAGISILGTNPAADHVPRQPRVRYVYLYFFFASTYMAGLQANDLTTRCAALLIYATLAFAVWQRACDRLPWLLDPVDEDRSRISLFDGGAATTIYGLLQAFVLLLLMGRHGNGTATALSAFVAMAIAGGSTMLLYLLLLAARGIDMITALGLRSRGGGHAVRAMGLGVVAGGILGGVGLLYVHLLHTYSWFDVPVVDLGDGQRPVLLALAIGVAPLIEEVLFRGLVFQGLQRTVKLPLAIAWSAALFAVVHPVHSWAPVFLLGAAAAFVFHRTRYLPAAMVTHAVYNAIVVGLGQ